MTLSTEEAQRELENLSGWRLEDGSIKKTYVWKDFSASLAFVNQVGDLAEAADHHPDILIEYNNVSLSLVSHDAGGLTEKDFQLAQEIERL